MAKNMKPRFKESRRFGVNIYNHPKALNKQGNQPQKKLSTYGIQLLEKQKLKAYYGVLEKQFRIYVQKAEKSSIQTGHALIFLLETRLDNLVYRLGFASSIRQARQMVVHRHILVNNNRVDRPSFQISPGDTISLREKSRKNQVFLENLNIETNFSNQYLELDKNKFEGRLLRQPQRHEIPIEISEHLIVEFYSR